jgi:hypothetical protein
VSNASQDNSPYIIGSVVGGVILLLIAVAVACYSKFDPAYVGCSFFKDDARSGVAPEFVENHDDVVAWPAELFCTNIATLEVIPDVSVNNSKPPLPPSGPDHVAWPVELF